jgi:hypothetical protein
LRRISRPIQNYNLEKGEATPLSIVEKELQVTLHDRLKKLLREEEIKWRQRAKKRSKRRRWEYKILPPES